MDDLFYVYAIAALMAIALGIQVLRGQFDPFAPIWLFLVGYAQVYVIQAISYHDWAVGVRGPDVVAGANLRALWGIAWLMAVYFFGPGRLVARSLPQAPSRWSVGAINMTSPFLIVWGLLCGAIVIRGAEAISSLSAEESLLMSFPSVMLVAGVLLIVTGRQPDRPSTAHTVAGVGVVVLYMLIWMLNGKRSHSLIAILAGVCAFYLPRGRRPSWPVLMATALSGAMAVGLAISWRYYSNREGKQGSITDFVAFVAEFDPSSVLEALNLADGETLVRDSYETEEYGGYLLIFDTVPMKSAYDHGVNYLRIFSTFIPRLVWPSKPLFGREQWVEAWIAGSELVRDETFTGPSIGILGACHLNGGGWATLIVLGIIGLGLRTGYEYFRFHSGSAWAQAWWALIYFNAWLMTVGDDPLTWFYYNYGFSTLPPMVAFWLLNRFASAGPTPSPSPR